MIFLVSSAFILGGYFYLDMDLDFDWLCLYVYFKSRRPLSKCSKHGLTSLFIPGHDPPVEITVFGDVSLNPGPQCSC